VLRQILKPQKAAVDWDKIKLLAFDCDGVLTRGGIIYGNEGQELKDFDARDGLGFMMLRSTDIQTAVITGRTS
jgi:3-deoxy-D-manno-octulosonate 8-phosphate phosphatase (KDO 8-P phosphatase)